MMPLNTVLISREPKGRASGAAAVGRVGSPACRDAELQRPVPPAQTRMTVGSGLLRISPVDGVLMRSGLDGNAVDQAAQIES